MCTGVRTRTRQWLTVLVAMAGLVLAMTPAAHAAPATTCVKTTKVVPPKPAKPHYQGTYVNSACTQASATDEGKYEKLQTPEEFTALKQQLDLEISLRSQAQIAAGTEEANALSERGVNTGLKGFLARGCNLLRTANLESPLTEAWWASVLAWRSECEEYASASMAASLPAKPGAVSHRRDRVAAAAIPATTCVKATKVTPPKPAKAHYTGGFVNSSCSEPSATGEGKYERLQTPEEFQALEGELASESANLGVAENALAGARSARAYEESLHGLIDGVLEEGCRLASTVLETAEPRPYFPELQSWQAECSAELQL